MYQKTSLLYRGIHRGTHHLILAAACLAGSLLDSRAELGLSREAYGVWDRTGYYNVNEYPFTRGQAYSEAWVNVNSARNVFNWAPMGAQLAFADAQNQMFNIQISTVGGSVGASMPPWMLDVNGGDVPSLTDGTFTYGYYLDPEFKVYYEEMVNSLANYVRNVVPPSQQARIAFVRVDTGATGDEEPYENSNLIPAQFEQYKITHEQWLAHRLWAFEVYRKAFQEGPGPVIPLLFGSAEPPGRQTEWDWITGNVLGGYGVKFGGTVRGHHLTDSQEISDVFKHLAVDPAPGVKLFSRNEMDGTWTKPFFQLNIRLNMYWAAVEQLDAGMSVWDVTGSNLSNTYVDDYEFAFEFFNRWAAELIPATARGGFCILHEGLDSSDEDKFPTSSFGGGSVSQGNTARYTAICNAYASQGARMDDLTGATKGAVWQRADTPGLQGFNDAGWMIVRGNYDRFITQINPDTTSKGLWRVNGTLTSNSHPYDRFARGFDSASGRNTMYFDLHDGLLPTPGQSVEFTVDYLDRGTGQFSLQYDAVGNNQKTAFMVTKTGTNTWKTASLVVNDWVCGNNGPNGADFMLLNVDSDDDIFHSVEVTKLGNVTLNKAGQGTVSARNDGYGYNPLGGVIEQGLRLDLSVTAAPGWKFAGWSGDLTGTNPRPIVFVGENTQITANFAYTGNYATGDDFNTGTWSGGSNWSGDWMTTGTATPGAVSQLIGNSNLLSQLTREIATPLPNATLSFDWDLDRISTSESGTVEVKVGDSWITVWTQNDKGTDEAGSPQLETATLNLSSYGSISAIRFTLNANGGGDRFWIDNVNITGSVPVHPPVFTADPFSRTGATQDAAYTGQTLAGSATDQNGDPLSYVKVSGPAWLDVAADGSLSGTPANSDVGNNSFTVRVSDGLDSNATASLNIQVANVNDAPEFTASPIRAAGATEDTPYSGQTLAGSATDVDAGTVLTYSKVSGPAWLDVAADGTLTGTPGTSDGGENSWTVQVSDGVATITALLEITVFKQASFISLSADDGFVTETLETSNVGGAVSATNSAGAALRIGDNSGNAQTKTIVSFDTSSLPDGATIIAATLRLKRGAMSGDPSGLGAINVDITGGTGFGGATSLAAGDFEATAGAMGVATLSYPSANGDWSTGTLNAIGLSWVDKTGKTQLRVQFASDDDNDSVADYVGFYPGEASNSSNRPVLAIVYQ